MYRILKRIFIAAIFFLIIGALITGIYFITHSRPNCDDGIQNGQEEGLDCGLVACGVSCPPPVLRLTATDPKLVKIGEGDYDFIFKVHNPNAVYGANFVDFDLTLVDASGTEVYKKNHDFYALPGQTKYVIIQALKPSGEPASGKVKLKSAQYTTINNFLNVSFPLRNQETLVNGSRSEFRGVIQNNSDFDFDFVEVRSVVIDNASGAIIAAARTNVRTLLSKSERQFEADWPFVIDFSKVRVDVEADTNLMENSNFLRRYGGSQERFQLYYDADD